MTYKKSLKVVLQSYFGERWYFGLTLLVVAIFWPVLAFWADLEFDPAKFTDTWVRSGIMGLLIVILFEALNFSRKTFSRKIHSQELLSEGILRPISKLQETLNRMRQADEDSPEILSEIRNEIYEHWSFLESSLPLVTGSKELDFQVLVGVKRVVQGLNVKNTGARVRELLTDAISLRAQQQSCEEIIARLILARSRILALQASDIFFPEERWKDN